jgi:hypothetical protein
MNAGEDTFISWLGSREKCGAMLAEMTRDHLETNKHERT